MKKLYSLLLMLSCASAAYGQASIQVPNDGTTGTTQYETATVNPTTGLAIGSATDTTIPAFIVVNGAGTSGQATLATNGPASCLMDSTNASASGFFYVIKSSTTAKYCHAQSTAPSSGTFVIGYLLSTSTATGVAATVHVSPYVYGGSGSMTWPGTAGLAVYAGSNTWGTSLSLGTAANNVPQLSANAALAGIKIINGVSYSANYTGATVDVRVNSCLSDALSLANGNTTGICDATGETGNQTVAATITVGNSSGNFVKLLLPPVAVWKGTMTSGPVVNQYTDTIVESEARQGTLPNGMVFTVSSSATPSSIYLTTPQSSGQGYLVMKGFTVTNVTGGHATTTGIGLDIVGPIYDVSLLDGVDVNDSLDTYAAKVIGVCCSTTWENSSINGNYASTPLWLSTTGTGSAGFTQQVTFLNMSIDHPAAGSPAILCSDTTAGGNSSAEFENLYTETSNSDTTTALYQIQGCSKVSFDHVILKANVASDAAPMVSTTNAQNTFVSIHDAIFRVGSGSWTYPATVISNGYTSETRHTDATGNFGEYVNTGVVGSLPVTALNGGTSASSSTYWRGDGTWATPAGSGTVNSGTTGHFSYYPASSAAVSSDTNLDDGQTNANGLTYGGSAGVFASSFNTTNTVNNTFLKYTTGSSGDSTCPSPAASTSYICTKSLGISASINNAAYSPIVVLGNAQTFAAVQTFPGGDLFQGGVDAQTGTSYTVVASDENKLLTFSNASAVAVTLPQATTTGFGSGAVFEVFNKGAGTVTITPTTSTINGNATLALSTGNGAEIWSDGTNYQVNMNTGSGGSGAITPTSVNGLQVSTGSNSTGVSLGTGALGTTSGNYNVAVGYDAFVGSSSAANSVVIGGFAGDSYSGTGGVAIGYSAGQNITGSNDITIGISAETSAAGDTNEIVIGNSATGHGSNTATFGNSSTTNNYFTGNVQAGSSGVAGSATYGNATSGTVTVQPVTGALGTVTASLPANTGTIAETNLAQSYSAVQTFPGGDLFIGGVDAQTGTSYTMVAADENKLLTLSNASAVAVTLPQATTTGFGSGSWFHVFNKGAGTVTITPTTSTINGAATLTLATNNGVDIFSDGTNYQVQQNTSSGSSASAGAFQTYGYDGGTNDSLTVAQTWCSSLMIPNSFTSGHFILNITSSDTTHAVDFGIYNHSGTLVAHTGAAVLAGANMQVFAWTGGTQTIPAGEDYFCATGNTGLTATSFSNYQNQSASYPWANISSATSGGALNSTITPPTDSPTHNTTVPQIILY